MFEALLFLHILGAAAWLGANLVRAYAGRVLTQGGGATAASWHRTTVSMGRWIHTPAAVTVFVTGFGLVGLDAATPLTAPFVVVGVIVVVLGAVLAMTVLGPNGERIAAPQRSTMTRVAKTTSPVSNHPMMLERRDTVSASVRSSCS